MYDHLMHAFCTGELCSGRVSIKLLPYYTFLENILAEGEAAQSMKGNQAIYQCKFGENTHIQLKGIIIRTRK